MNAGIAERNEADRLLRLLVRRRVSCERCSRPGTQVAHILPRRFNATRCDERNVWLLCAEDHAWVDQHATDRSRLIEGTIGPRLHAELRRIAYGGPQGSLRAFWADEVERLRVRCNEEGIVP